MGARGPVVQDAASGAVQGDRRAGREARRDERQALIDELTGRSAQKLKELGVKAEVEGRPKHLYSIYEKMVIRGKEFEEIYDLVGVRILAGSLRDCYAALGAVHSLWKPIPGRFKDYVAMPKSNMYQSLHTTVVGPDGTPLEIQIRTRDMHRTAQYGIAAHWRYKEGGKQSKDTADMAWLGQMMEWLKDMADPREFMEGLKIDLYGGRVFVFTPKGDVMNLPQGATPVDFSYAIHTEVGHRTIGAKVNGKLVPLDYELRTGDSVDVLTSKAQGEGPSQDWLQFVATPARAEQDPAMVRSGAPRGCARPGEGPPPAADAQAEPLLQTAHHGRGARAGRDGSEAARPRCAVRRGRGGPRVTAIGRRPVVETVSSGSAEEDVTEVPLARPVRITRPDVAKGVIVEGLGDVWVRLGRCCTPVPGDEIVGFVTRGQGVSRAPCRLPEREVPPARARAR